jgi:hypothetical protein
MKNQTKRGRLEGVESKGPAPTPYLNRIADVLRQPPGKPVKNPAAFKRLLGIKTKRTGHGEIAVAHWLKNNIGEREIDHYMPLTLDTGDVLLLTQPYHHPDKDALKHVEARGGYIVHPHQGWGFLHLYCLPDAYLIPTNALTNFDTR